MSQFLSANEAAQRVGLSYIRVLAACRSGDLAAQRIGPSFAINEQDLVAWAERARELADPNIIEKLQAEIAQLKAENRALRNGRVA